MDFTDAPLTQLPNGAIRVTGSRVTLDVLMNLIKKGYTAERINDSFPSVSVAQISSIMEWYRSHQAETEEYLLVQQADEERLLKELEKQPGYAAFREKFRQRKAQLMSQNK